jgi:HlyD family secretion protein
MKKWLIAIVVLALLAGGGTLALSGGRVGMAASQPKAAATPWPAVKAGRQVVAEARVVPVRSVQLSLPAGGVVAEVLVAAGDQVTAGQVLVRLEAARPAAAVVQAEAQLQRAQTELDKLRAGPRSQEIGQAQAAVEAAQARLARFSESPGREEVAAAEAAVASTQAALQRISAGPEEDATTIAAAEVRRAEIALKQAQWDYDRVAYGDSVGASPEAARLEQATLDYKAAVAVYRQATHGPTQADVAAAESRLAQAKADLARVQQPASRADIAEVQAEVRRTQAQLEMLQAGAQPQDVALAEADVVAAQAALAQARAALAETELRSPFAGTVASIEVKPGGYAAAGSPVAQLADLSAWQVETDDLTELRIVDVRAGAPVTVTVDAIPGLELTGSVVRVEAIGENKFGDITYGAVIRLDRQDERLRWNMTASVSIQ